MNGELQDCIETRTVQQGDGCFTVVLPSGPAAELGIEPGDTVAFTGEVGASGLQPQKGDTILAKH